MVVINGVIKRKRKKIFVGLSGGVDSSVTALLLKNAGHEVTGVFIKVWQPKLADKFADCDWKAERRDAKRICAQLNIPFIFLDLEKEYKKHIFDNMIAEYKTGRTPNPDVLCNKYIKFGSFLDFALSNCADGVATGHYAQIKQNTDNTKKAKNTESNKKITHYRLLKGTDESKDQSYFLWALRQKQLSKIYFPLGKMQKPHVREIALKNNLITAQKKDSQGLCFVGKIDIKSFLAQYIKPVLGDVLDIGGNKIGTHDGAHFFTIGQRHGFSVKHTSANSTPLYVASTNITNNTITVSTNTKLILRSKKNVTVKLTGINIISDLSRYDPSELTAQIRYHGKHYKVQLKNNEVKFLEPVLYMALGQSLVLYNKNELVGGGMINKIV